jgi:hypothetical protein
MGHLAHGNRVDPLEPRLVAAPRLDWRFLLADPELDRVGYVGRREGGTLAMLRLLCRSVDVLDAGDPGSGGSDATEQYDVVVACAPSGAKLRRAAGRVRPGGTLVVETSGPGGVVRRVSGFGFEDVRSYWHWPSFERCTRIIPLDDRMAVQCALSRSGRGIRAQAVAWLGQMLLKVGLLTWAVACVSVIGRRPRETQPAKTSSAARGVQARQSGPEPASRDSSVVHAFLAGSWARLGLDRQFASRPLSFVVLTPRFRSSSHLIYLILHEGKPDPVLVAKVPRLRGRCAKTEGEAERLQEIQAYRPGGFDSIPRLVAFETFRDRMILLETAMWGRAMDRATVRKNAPQCCEATLAWLIEVQTATRLAPEPGGNGFERLIDRELLHARATFPAERSLLERTQGLVTPLSAASLPLVLEHGDLSHPNLLVGRGGRVAVIDWELAELRGLPASDLFFFLTYVAMARRGARSSQEALVALEQAFFGQGSWARTYVRRYAEALGLSRDLLTPLFIACWVRQVAGLVRRVANGREVAGGESAEGLRQDWRFAVWRHAVEQADRLDWEEDA